MRAAPRRPASERFNSEYHFTLVAASEGSNTASPLNFEGCEVISHVQNTLLNPHQIQKAGVHFYISKHTFSSLNA